MSYGGFMFAGAAFLGLGFFELELQTIDMTRGVDLPLLILSMFATALTGSIISVIMSGSDVALALYHNSTAIYLTFTLAFLAVGVQAIVASKWFQSKIDHQVRYYRQAWFASMAVFVFINYTSNYDVLGGTLTGSAITNQATPCNASATGGILGMYPNQVLAYTEMMWIWIEMACGVMLAILLSFLVDNEKKAFLSTMFHLFKSVLVMSMGIWGILMAEFLYSCGGTNYSPMDSYAYAAFTIGGTFAVVVGIWHTLIPMIMLGAGMAFCKKPSQWYIDLFHGMTLDSFYKYALHRNRTD